MRYFSGSLCLILIISMIVSTAEAQSWQAEMMTGWTSATSRDGAIIQDNIHLGTSLSRTVTPHWRASAMYILQAPSGNIDYQNDFSILVHNLSAGMVYEEPDENAPICLFGGWLAGAVLYDPRNTTTATEVQPVVNTVMGFRGHIQPRIGYKIQGLFLMPIFSDRDRLFDTDLQLGAGPVLTQVAANFGITYAF